MPEKIVVRPAKNTDFELLIEFIAPFVKQQKLLPRTKFELEELVDSGFVAVCNEGIVGFAALEVYSQKMAEIRSLAVAKKYRGSGVGKQLVEACLQLASERAILEVMAISSADAFFLSCGFDYTLPGEKRAFFFQTRDD